MAGRSEQTREKVFGPTTVGFTFTDRCFRLGPDTPKQSRLVVTRGETVGASAERNLKILVDSILDSN